MLLSAYNFYMLGWYIQVLACAKDDRILMALIETIIMGGDPSKSD